MNLDEDDFLLTLLFLRLLILPHSVPDQKEKLIASNSGAFSPTTLFHNTHQFYRELFAYDQNPVDSVILAAVSCESKKVCSQEGQVQDNDTSQCIPGSKGAQMDYACYTWGKAGYDF